ncbi:ribosome maturation factor RimP [Mycobacterium sp. CVI_P3]|uniref:Ribosome maturation factor RimP n=1 Tax=Mycobacterium pinniadriaticum TaxID=2994102 RepID=A0ABT3SIA2_9MYCO|nr:ribosome maturation factor RimP [Mycobacterium pinniadriaticum]MCX2932280.1 ribosome maturation factor RimP [Mycobacterium pinniadriaticum]MCX2938620.1 ribosome maturation factor RimP [Mycobacterium pinniadriaticum]
MQIRTTQDEELAVAGRSTGLPTQKQVIELLDGEFVRAGYEIEDVVIDARTQPPRITVMADGDVPLDLDTVAELSRAASALLDELDGGDGAYVLEVTSPGVERPLTAEKHFRRAHARLVDMELADGTTATGRLGRMTESAVDLVVRDRGDWKVRQIPLADIIKAVVQVEFSPPKPREMELAGAAGTEADA